MAWPWGGSKTHAELAQKFGWPSIIITIILYPFLYLFSKLIAFPFWLEYIWPSKNWYGLKTQYHYDKEDFIRKEIYTSLETHTTFPAGFIPFADVEGGKWIESFFGIIHAADLDTNDNRMIITPNPHRTIFPATCWLEFPDAPVKEHCVRFYFPILGPNIINPFMWIAMTYLNVSVFWFALISVPPFFKREGCRVTNTVMPPAEDKNKMLADGSIPYEHVPEEGEATESTPLKV